MNELKRNVEYRRREKEQDAIARAKIKARLGMVAIMHARALPNDAWQDSNGSLIRRLSGFAVCGLHSNHGRCANCRRRFAVKVHWCSPQSLDAADRPLTSRGSLPPQQVFAIFVLCLKLLSSMHAAGLSMSRAGSSGNHQPSSFSLI